MKKILLSALTIAASMSVYADYADFSKIVYLPMDITGETLENKMGEDGTLSKDSEGTGATAVEGFVGGAAQFDGKSWYEVPFTANLNFGENDFTLEFLFKSVDGTLSGYALMLGTNTADWVGFEFKDPNLLFAAKGGGTKSQAGLACLEDVVDGEWHHIIAVRDHVSLTLDLYLDGILIDSKTDKTKPIEIDLPFYVGCNPTPSILETTPPFTGCLDEVAIFNGAMAMTDVEERYEDLTTTGGINAAIASMENATVTVYNLNGVEVARGAGNVDSLVNGLDKDLYVVVVSNGTAREVKKFIKK